MQGKLGEILGHQGHQPGIVGARRDFAEDHLVATDKEFDTKQTIAAETLGLPTSPYRFARDIAAFRQAVSEIGYPCFVKPVMSSSGK